jgi:hypothetical protein
MIGTIEAVMPVRLSGSKERLTGQRLLLFLDSFTHAWDELTPLKLTIVGVADELAMLRQLTRGRSAAEITVIDERELIDHPAIMRTVPWNRQMFIKLLFARLCGSDAYLYLDADIICVGRLRRQNFVRDGKAISDWELKEYHPKWWAEARRLLGRPSTDRRRGLTVTPNVLTRQLALEVPDVVARAQGRDPIEALAASFELDGQGWSENTIYTELGEMNGALDRLHHGLETQGAFHSPASVWWPADLKRWRPILRLCRSPARFLVVQSTTYVSPAWLRFRLAPLLYGPLWR